MSIAMGMRVKKLEDRILDIEKRLGAAEEKLLDTLPDIAVKPIRRVKRNGQRTD